MNFDADLISSVRKFYGGNIQGVTPSPFVLSPAAVVFTMCSVKTFLDRFAGIAWLTSVGCRYFPHNIASGLSDDDILARLPLTGKHTYG